MDFFDKATKVAKEVGNSVVSVGNTIGNVTREQTEVANMKIQRAAIEKKLESRYAEIGKRYVEYLENPYQYDTFDVSDIIDQIKPELEKIAEIDAQLEQREQQIRQNNLEKDRKKAQDQFDAEKKKLDRAKELEVVTEEEYSEKLAKAQKKLENFETLRKIELQYQMDIISKEEYEEKVKSILQ